MRLSKNTGLLLILVSCLVAWLVANAGVDHQKLEMASIANTFVPPLCGLASLALFAVVDRFFRKRRLTLVIVLMLINLSVGISIRLESETITRRAVSQHELIDFI